TVNKKAAVLEMPVAVIKKHDSLHVVTIWKEQSKRKREDLQLLYDFLNSENIPVDLAKKASLSAIRQLAKLHANGFVHGHPGGGNVLVSNRGIATLIDYSEIRRSTPRTINFDVNYMIHSIIDRFLYKPGNPDEFKTRLIIECQRAFDLYKTGSGFAPDRKPPARNRFSRIRDVLLGRKRNSR
ncbi:MAG: hypothetical protein ABH863_03040, partial [Candidatus Micrarchaeota archaeon]